MRNQRLTLLVAVGGWALMSAMIGCDRRETEVVTAKEFVCYTDGKLTERHVGVEDVSFWYQSLQVTIFYTDGVVSRYYPAAGESCQLESIAANVSS